MLALTRFVIMDGFASAQEATVGWLAQGPSEVAQGASRGAVLTDWHWLTTGLQQARGCWEEKMTARGGSQAGLQEGVV